MEKFLLILVLFLEVNSNNICTNVREVTVCRNLTLNRPLKIENYKNSLRLQPPIEELPGGVFANLPNLETLIITFTLMEKIYSRSFVGLSNLKKLDLYWNQIPELPPNVFHHCPNLIYLNIGGNNLESFQSNAFSPLKNLRELIISSNLLTSVPDLQDLNLLKSLDLSRNKITKLNRAAFPGLKSLISLNLKGNLLSHIEEGALLGLENLELLNLEKNELEHLDVANFRENLPRLAEVRISINNFKCEVLEEVIADFVKNEIVVPEGLAEPEPFTRHGIFCIAT